MNKGSKLYSIFNNKCPRCHEGDFFVSGNAYDILNFTKMYPECSKCDQTYEPEPGYYFGAMYVSYAINVAIFVAVWVAINVLFNDDLNVWLIVSACVVTGLLLFPINFRLSRLTWINFFVKFNSNFNNLK